MKIKNIYTKLITEVKVKGKQITPRRFIYHASIVNYRNQIMNEGLKTCLKR